MSACFFVLLLSSGVFPALTYGIGVNLTIGDLGSVLGSIEQTEWSNRTVFSYLGIPYAEPPIGELRFRPPVKITPWNQTLNATSYGTPCPQKAVASYSEDCLTLNVLVPERKNDDTLLPVLIFIHGGTFRVGQASLYHPQRLLYDRDLIVVVPQFRLGFLGLFSLETDDVPGNVQFLDQIMAMQWVQDNIAYFGGDRQRVTLYGHSSGAASVHFHLLSPLTKGLFHQTILQSGSALRTYGVDDNPRESAVILASYCGCNASTEANYIAACMRRLEVEIVVNCTNDYLDEMIYDGLTRARGHMAVVQKEGPDSFLTDNPKDLLARGEFHRLPMVGGVTRRDGAIYLKDIYKDILLPHGLANNEHYAGNNLTGYVLKYMGLKDITGSIEHSMVKTYLKEEELGDLVAMAPGLIDICSVIAYKSGSHRTLEANMVSQDTYLYTFNYEIYDSDPETTAFYPFDMSSGHGDDTKLLFPRLPYQRKVDLEMAKILVDLWISFVIDGVPKAEGIIWPRMSNSVGPYLVIDSELLLKDNFINEFITSDGKSSTIKKLPLIDRWYLSFLIIACAIVGNKLFSV